MGKSTRYSICAALITGVTLVAGVGAPALAATEKPNIVVIMGDDIGWFNIGAYHRGMMSGKTPNIDRLASEGMMFTDYYAAVKARYGQ